MNIDMYVAAFSLGNGSNRSAGCATILLAEVPDGRVLLRKAMYALGNSTLNLANVQACRLAIMSLRPWVSSRGLSVILHCSSNYVRDMLAKVGGSYNAEPKTNIDAVLSLRNWFDDVPHIALNNEKSDSGICNACLSLARSAAESQAFSDSGTKEFANVRETGLQTENSGASG